MLSLTYKISVDDLGDKWSWPITHWQMYLINELGFKDDIKISVELDSDHWTFTQALLNG